MKTGTDINAVLLCAEDDDLELVELVHFGRQRDLEFEVVPGVEVDDDPMAQAVARNAEALFVVLRSEHLSRERALQLKHRFESLRKAGQHLLAIRLDPERTSDALDTIAARLKQLGGCEPSRLPIYESFATNGYPTIDQPIADDDDGMPPPPVLTVGRTIDVSSTGPRPIVAADTEYAITERSPIVSDETTPVQRLDDVKIVKPAPKGKPAWLLVAAAGGLIALGSAVAGAMAFVGDDDDAKPHAPAVVIETEVEEADPNEGVRVAEPPPPPAAVVHPLDPKVTDKPAKKKKRR